MQGFEAFKLNKQLLSAIEALGYQSPTPIQQEAIPLVLAGHDVIGIAQTGTGKTAAYVLPLLMKVKYAQGVHPRALILAPTRELAVQIGDAITGFTQFCDLRHTVIYGGTGAKPQIEALQAGIDILVATPGRLMDLYLKGEVYLREIKTLILDEADKMMDMGFMPQIRRVLEIIPTKRQNLLFSATMSEKVIQLSEEFLEFPARVEVTPQATAAETVSQSLYHLPNLRTKIDCLSYLLSDEERFNRVIVFTRRRQIAEDVYRFLLRKLGEDAVRVIHANKGQNTRLNAFEDFRAGNIRVLVATDVAARGIDVSMVSHVINFDVPLVYEDYVHRIGRTGRADQRGEAITFVTMAEEYHIQKIEKLIKTKIPVAQLPAAVEVYPTPFAERQAMLREIDNQRKREDPAFQGAFHEKKRFPPKQTKKTAEQQKNKAKRRRR
ncbi:DEAD/DEAH box helicase [Eisenibacter elegans]|jgi:ATP-dependent RNA helicase RhlE|uniref:DEAD/DEAH box helicase n=1 Tax=Eisenibacter elegans TaxID=997 RepID=UPI00041BD33D|nr:DEAD/DEAH box helicase [Eisenibacter elegans]